MFCYQNYTSSNTSPTVPDNDKWGNRITANTVITGGPFDNRIQIQVSVTTSEASDLPATTPPPPPRPVKHWRIRPQKVRPFFAPRPEFHARSNPVRYRRDQ